MRREERGQTPLRAGVGGGDRADPPAARAARHRARGRHGPGAGHAGRADGRAAQCPLGARRLRAPLVGAGGRAGRRPLGVVLRPARPHRRVDELHRPHRAHRSRGRGERAHRLAGARRPAVLLRDVGHAARGDPATAFPARRNGARRAGRRFPRRCAGPAADRFRIRFRSGAARRAEGAARVDDARHRDDDPGRAGRDHPAAALRRRRDRGRPRDREDRGRAAPRRLPALHPSRAAGPQRRAGRRPQRRVHPVRRGRAPRAGRVGGGVHHPRPAGARRRRDRRRSGRGGPHEGRPGDAGRPAPRRRRPAGAARVADRDRARRRHRRDRPGDGGGSPQARPGHRPAPQRRTATFRDTLGSLLVHAGRRAARPGPGGPARARRAPPRARRPPGDRAGGCGGGVGGAAPRAARRPALGPRLPRGGRAALAGADPGAGPRRALRVAGPAGLGRRRDRPLRAVPRRRLRVDGRGRAAARRAGRAARSPRPGRRAPTERSPDNAPTPPRC